MCTVMVVGVELPAVTVTVLGDAVIVMLLARSPLTGFINPTTKTSRITATKT
jgi:hypothetical protein